MTPAPLAERLAADGIVEVRDVLPTAAAREARARLVRTSAWELGGHRPTPEFGFRFLRVTPADAWFGALAAELHRFVREVCGETAETTLDLHGTCYTPGSFLLPHDDSGGRRRFAYVVHLCTGWRPEWGGLLRFEDRTIVPQFNALTLFRVPRMHEVTPVRHDAPRERYALSGWLRRA